MVREDILQKYSSLSYPELQAKVKELGISISLTSKKEVLLDALVGYEESLAPKPEEVTEQKPEAAQVPEIKEKDSKPEVPEAKLKELETQKLPEVPKVLEVKTELELVEMVNSSGKKRMSFSPDQVEPMLSMGWKLASDYDKEEAKKKEVVVRPENSVKITNGKVEKFVPIFNVETLLKPLGNWELCEGEVLPKEKVEPKVEKITHYTRSGLMVAGEAEAKRIYQQLTGIPADVDWDLDRTIDFIIFVQEENEKVNKRVELD